jgi:hypothetical protein
MWRLLRLLRCINCYPKDDIDWPKHAKTASFFKKMAVNRYSNHVLSIINCIPQHCFHYMYCYKTYHYKRYTKCKHILFITTLPYRITPKHVIILAVKCPNMGTESVCKFRSNIKDVCTLNTMRIFFKAS